MSRLIEISRLPNFFIFSFIILALFVYPEIIRGEEELEFASVEERRLHATMLEERASIFEEKKELALREKELKSLEEAVDKKLAEIDNKLQELEESKQQLAELLEEKTAEELKRIQELSKIYEKMDPVKAAIALSGLEQRLAADLLANMKVKAAAKILDSLNKVKATEISKTFSTIQLE